MQMDSYVNGIGIAELVSPANNSVKNNWAWETLQEYLSKDHGKHAPPQSKELDKICQN